MKKALILIAVLVACESSQPFEINDEYIARFEKKTEGGLAYGRPYYLQLVGFYRLDPMTPNRFGTSPDNEHVTTVEGTPSIVGSFTDLGDTVVFRAAENIEVKTEEDSVVQELKIVFDENMNSIDLFHGQISWRIVKYADDRKYLRIRDMEHPALEEFTGYQKFDFTTDFIFNGKFTAYDPPKVAPVSSNVDFARTATFVGNIAFDYQGKVYSLDVQAGNHIMFSDETSAIQTYGSGRYMKYSEPSEDGSVILDFNYAYNPPCIFSDYTTCLFPPAQNRLPFEVLAGEITEEL